MVVVKPEQEVIRKKINQLKLDRVRARAKNKILSHILLQIKEGKSIQELEEIINKLIVSNVQYEQRISTVLDTNYYVKGSFNSWDLQKKRRELYKDKLK
jgi:hypothetical protein